jgi:tRNA (cmo5U34)-methyltransferase
VDHVARSVPYYLETHRVAVEMSDWFVSDQCRVYDLGCSTGNLIGDLYQRHQGKNIRYTGIDKSHPMLKEAEKAIGALPDVTLRLDDALSMPFEPEISLIYCLYTLQFINPQKRIDLCRKIHDSLSRRGGLILVEKVLDSDSVMTDIYTHLHWTKKAELGFDVTEIYGKAQSLRGVLVPFTAEENFQLLQESGFSRVSVFFKWCNFIGIVAVK